MTKLQERLSNNKAVTTHNKNGDTILDLIKKSEPQFKMALGKAIDPERFTRIALTIVRQNPKLMQCSSMSLLGALMQSAQLGLEPNILGQSYIIPYNNKGRMEAQFQIGYKGLLKLFYNSENALSIQAQEVYENDDFEFEYGLNPKLFHKPALENRGNVIAYYAVAKLKNGAEGFAVMSKADLEKFSKQYSESLKGKYPQLSPWTTEFDEMAKKTVIKKVLKYMPLSTERFINMDETIKNFDSDTSIDMTEVPDETAYEEVDNEGLDNFEVKTRREDG